MKFFTLREDYTVELNKEELLLVKEFEDLFSLKFNAGEKGDMDGRKRQKAFKVLAYIYLVHDWKSPYSEFSKKEKHDAALTDTGLTTEAVKEELVEKAIEKYLSLQDSRILKLLNSAYKAVDEIRMFFESINLTQLDPVTGKYMYSATDVMKNLSSLAKTVESMQQLESIVKKEKEQDKGLRGDIEPGMFD